MSNRRKNLNNMMGLDAYLSSLSKEKFQAIKGSLDCTLREPHPLVSWDIVGMYEQQMLKNARKQEELQVLKNILRRYDCKTDLKKILMNDYYALVLSDLASIIQWVNRDFKTMTGYSEKFILGKTPGFLQGKNTLEATKTSIREKLNLRQPFAGSIINYRKNLDEYVCQVNIYPIRSKQNEVTHFLALEKEVI